MAGKLLLWWEKDSFREREGGKSPASSSPGIFHLERIKKN
jgi:hypothetical protein